MPGRIRVAHFDGQRQGLDGRPYRLPEFIQGQVELFLGFFAGRDVPEDDELGWLTFERDRPGVDLDEDWTAFPMSAAATTALKGSPANSLDE
jgi:hypothetical protein